MNATSHSSGPRSNAYSGNRFTNRRYYDPFALEIAAVLKRYDGKIPESPKHPWIIVLPLHEGFLHPCTKEQVEQKLHGVPPTYVEGLRAIFILAGTNKQVQCWRGKLCCYGWYWRNCIFLHAHPLDLGRYNLDSIRDFYLDDVLLHEIGHHVDRLRCTDSKTAEGYANWFAVHSNRETPVLEQIEDGECRVWTNATNRGI